MPCKTASPSANSPHVKVWYLRRSEVREHLGDFAGALRDAVVGGRSLPFCAETHLRQRELLLRTGRKKLSYRIGDLLDTPQFKGFLQQNGNYSYKPEEAAEPEEGSPPPEGIAKVPLGEKHLAKHLGELQFGTDDELDNIFPEVRGLLRSEGMMKDLLGPPSLLGKKQSFKHSLLS